MLDKPDWELNNIENWVLEWKNNFFLAGMKIHLQGDYVLFTMFRLTWKYISGSGTRLVSEHSPVLSFLYMLWMSLLNKQQNDKIHVSRTDDKWIAIIFNIAHYLTNYVSTLDLAWIKTNKVWSTSATLITNCFQLVICIHVCIIRYSKSVFKGTQILTALHHWWGDKTL